MIQKNFIGRVTLRGIHNEFLDRDIMDYKLLLNHNIHSIPISSGLVKLNTPIYTDFKFSNQIRELGGNEFLFKINEFRSSSYDNVEILLLNNNNQLIKCVFNPIKVSNKCFTHSFEYEGTKYNLSYEYDILNVDSINLKMNSIQFNCLNPGKYRLFMWCESNLGKTYLYDNLISPNVLIDMLKQVYIGNSSDNFTIKGEIFNSHEVSLIQFEKKLKLGNYEVIKENYKKENFSINLSYSVST